MTMYAGDELYDDDVTSGPAEDERTFTAVMYQRLPAPGGPVCWRHYIRLSRGECPDCREELEYALDEEADR